MVYALLSAIFAALTAVLGKVGIRGVESNLGTAIRTGVVLVMAWVVVFVSGKQHTVRRIAKKELGGNIGIGLFDTALCKNRRNAAEKRRPKRIYDPHDEYTLCLTQQITQHPVGMIQKLLGNPIVLGVLIRSHLHSFLA